MCVKTPDPCSVQHFKTVGLSAFAHLLSKEAIVPAFCQEDPLAELGEKVTHDAVDITGSGVSEFVQIPHWLKWPILGDSSPPNFLLQPAFKALNKPVWYFINFIIVIVCLWSVLKMDICQYDPDRISTHLKCLRRKTICYPPSVLQPVKITEFPGVVLLHPYVR